MNRLTVQFDLLRERLAASEPIQRAWARFETSTPAQQHAMRAAAVTLGAILVCLLVLWPLHNFSETAQQRYRAQLDTLAWMQANRHLVRSGGGSRTSDDSLLSIATRTASAMGLDIRRYEPAGTTGLNLWLENVPFEQSVLWLEMLEREQQITTTEFFASRRGEGRVDIRVVLEG